MHADRFDITNKKLAKGVGSIRAQKGRLPPFADTIYKDSSRLQSARYGEGIRHAMHRGGMEHKHIYDVSV